RFGQLRRPIGRARPDRRRHVLLGGKQTVSGTSATVGYRDTVASIVREAGAYLSRACVAPPTTRWRGCRRPSGPERAPGPRRVLVPARRRRTAESPARSPAPRSPAHSSVRAQSPRNSPPPTRSTPLAGPG